jgi:hypothetical protein
MTLQEEPIVATDPAGVAQMDYATLPNLRPARPRVRMASMTMVTAKRTVTIRIAQEREPVSG